MKITAMELFPVPPRWLFLKISTDTGLSGWGEPTLEGHVETITTAVQEISTFLIGQDPTRIEDLWHLMYRGRFYRGGPVLMSAIAGVDQALWDLKGKHYGLPIYEFLGGAVRNKIPLYSWVGGDTPSEAAQEAQKRAAVGFKAVKMNATGAMHYIDSYDKVDEVLVRIGEVRSAMGNAFGIAIDFHGRVHKAMAKILAKELEQFHPLFIEEPVLPENEDAFREIAQHTVIPIATGERLYTRWDFKHLLHDGYIDIIQPDLSHAGGISEVKKIVGMAEAYDIVVAPHCPLGPIALSACLHIDACTHNFLIQEQSLNIHYNTSSDLLDYLLDPSVFSFQDGYVKVPSGPGLSIEMNEPLIRDAAAHNHIWHNPVWRTEDGAIAEW